MTITSNLVTCQINENSSTHMNKNDMTKYKKWHRKSSQNEINHAMKKQTYTAPQPKIMITPII